MQSWGKQREVERVKEPVALSREQAKLIGDTLNGAIGSALAKLTGAAGDRGRGPEPERTPAKDPNVRALERSADALAGVVLPAADFEELYQKIKRRLIDECRVDPILLHLLTTSAPEMRIDVEPRIEELSGSTMRGRVARLMGAGWFDEPRATSAVRRELARIGSDPGGGGTLGDILNKYVADGFLTREGDGYQKAPGVKISENVLTAV